ncbi:MAG: hypothetical protein NZO58_14755, partial [Gemmataceae bacterium]|nr:hypothetical protein [Gemmataceae bacterium]
VSIGGVIEDFDPKTFFEKKDRKRLAIMSRPFQLAAAAAKLAVEDAGLNLETLDPTRLATVLGTGAVACEPVEFALGGSRCVIGAGRIDLHRWGREGMSLVPPTWMLAYIPNMVGCHVSVMNNAQGPSNTMTQTDVAGLLALAEACRYLERGAADVVLVGGGDTRVSVMSLVRQQIMQPISRRNHEPTRACRPFDRDRDGLVLGEGGAVFVVETAENAQRRGARIYAEILGYGAAFDTSVDRRLGRWPRGAPILRDQPYTPRPGKQHGLTRAIRSAVQQAAIAANQLDHVNAHGLGTVADDHWEACGLAEALGPGAVPVFAPKSYFGLLGGATAAVELAASLLAMHHRQLPATLNCDHPDPNCPVRVATTARSISKPYFLKVSFTELGQCAAVVCRASPAPTGKSGSG